MRIVVNGMTKKRSNASAAEAMAVGLAAAVFLVLAVGSLFSGPACGGTCVVSLSTGGASDEDAASSRTAANEAQTRSQTQSAKAQPQAQQPPAESVRDAFIKAYRIGPGDLLEVKVFEIDQLNQTVRVSEDGAITLPLIGRVEVGGLTQDGIVAKLTDLLKAKYVKDPQVTIFIKEYKSNQVAVIGAVKEPGSYELVGRKNLLQVISMAGGFTESAMDVIYVLRQSDGAGGAARTIPIDLRELVVKGNQELNIPIEPNDVVNVPIDKEIRVFVMGRVNKPGAVKFKLSENASLLQAIADAGGFAEGARRGAVVITRKDKSGKERKIRVNIKDILSGKRKDIALEEGDVIFVPESFW